MGRGRHDPCVLPRAVPIVEAMTALVFIDHRMRHHAQCVLFLSGINERKASHHSRNSKFRKTIYFVEIFIKEQTDPFASFLLPNEFTLVAPHSNWAWSQNNFELRELSGSSEVDFFPFFSNQIDLANQFEAILKVLAEKKTYQWGGLFSS